MAWDAHRNGVHAYTAWLFEERNSGVYVLTDEMQTEWLARLGALAVPSRMSKWQDAPGKVAVLP